MEDDEETQSPVTGSPFSQQSNGRITVTLAAAPPLQNTPTLALPRNGGTGGGGREDCWSEGATGVLIEAWGERYLELSRGNLKQKHWKEVAEIVCCRDDFMKTPKSDIQCKNRIDTVKKKYKSEKAKLAAGGGPSKWPFFDRLDYLIGPTAKISASAAGHKVPMGIPVAIKPINQYQPQQQKKKNQQIGGRGTVDSDWCESEPVASPDSIDSFRPETNDRKRPKIEKGQLGNSVRELTQAILKFGEAYEQAESSKLQQVIEMEKQRMKFAKELEMQKMQFFMKTHLEISQLKQRRSGNSSNQHNNHNNNNSDRSN